MLPNKLNEEHKTITGPEGSEEHEAQESPELESAEQESFAKVREFVDNLDDASRQYLEQYLAGNAETEDSESTADMNMFDKEME